MKFRSLWIGAAIVALILVAAVFGRSRQVGMALNASSSSEFSQKLEAVGVAGRAEAADAVAMQRAAVASTAMTPPVQPVSRVQAPTSTGMIIRNGDVSIEVDSVQRAIDAVRRVAASVGGYIGNVQMATGEHQVHSATLEMKVPAARFDDAMTGVRPIGEVERSSASAEDVGEEFVDVSARIANGKRLEERLVKLLDTRTGKLADVLSIERELARVREEIERYEGRIRYLSSRIATSTISVTVHEKPPIVAETPGNNPIRLAFIGMWRNMVGVVAFAIEGLGVLLPPLALALIGVLIWRRTRRRSLPAAT
jgi:hypothetical protein